MNYILLEAEGTIPAIEQLSPFKCVVVIEDDVTEKWQAEVSRWLVATGCLYMMAWGKQSETWDCSVDIANIDYHGPNISDDDFVMTTWHDNEPLSEVFWFCKNMAFHEKHELGTVILHISSENKEVKFKVEYDRV